MCGIAGFYKKDGHCLEKKVKWENVLEEMGNVQKHRGPDEDGTYLEDKCGMAHVRLSIIDINNGHQPMTRTENGRKCTIVYNGEIYNMRELREQLIYSGVKLDTCCDTEVILAGYMKYGIAFIDRLNGIYSFAIRDYACDKMILVRDRIGVKPLFYMDTGNELIFSSEIKGIFRYPGIKPEADLETMQIIIGLGPAKPLDSGVFKNVRELEPGHMIIVENNEWHDYTYWRLISQPHEDDYDVTVAKTSWLIRDAVKKQMISDVPVCTFLSGGVDSSLVTAICSLEMRKKGRRLDTFSFDFIGNDKYFRANSFQPTQDRPYVDMVKRYWKTNHTYLFCNCDEQINNLYSAVDARDLPCMADVESSMLYFCRQVAKRNKVVLTGECADEIFGGYPWFWREDMLKADTFPWAMDISARKQWLKDDYRETINIEDYIGKQYRMSLDKTPLLRGEGEEDSRRRKAAYLNLKWFMMTLLNRMDRASMYSGLEARVPFADHRIVEYIWNVPWEMKCHGNNGQGIVKGLMRDAGKGLLPKEVLYRKKSPYPKTYNPEYERKLFDMVMDITANPNAPVNMIYDRKKIEKARHSKSDYGKPWYGQLMAGPQLLAYIIQIDYWLTKYKLDPAAIK